MISLAFNILKSDFFFFFFGRTERLGEEGGVGSAEDWKAGDPTTVPPGNSPNSNIFNI